MQTVSVIAAFVSAMCLYYASIGPDEKSWKGETRREVALRRRQAVLKWIGIPAAIIALACQLWAIHCQTN